MSDIVERLEMVRFFSDDVMAVRLPQDEAVIDLYRSERKEAAAEIRRLRATIDQLRSVVGAAAVEIPLMTFADIKKSLKDNG
jgi:hypothetical protein